MQNQANNGPTTLPVGWEVEVEENVPVQWQVPPPTTGALVVLTTALGLALVGVAGLWLVSEALERGWV